MQVGRLKIANVCAGDAILTRFLLDDVEQLVADGHDTCQRIAGGFHALIEPCRKPVPPKGVQLEAWTDYDRTCIFTWKGAGVS